MTEPSMTDPSTTGPHMDEPARLVPFGGPIDADVTLPGSKSMTNRLLMAAGLATGTSTLVGALQAEDTLAMMDAVTALGARVDHDGAVTRVTGRGSGSGSEITINARQSGTTSRFVLPVLACTPGAYVLEGEAQLRSRPFDDQISALRFLGADITELGEPGHLPVRIVGKNLQGGTVSLPGDASSQFLSGLMLSAPLMADGLTIELTTDLVSRPYVELTATVMRLFGLEVSTSSVSFCVGPGQYTATTATVEPDASAASYFFGAAAVTRGRCRVLGLGSNSTQGDLGFVDVLGDMGAVVTKTNAWTEVYAPSALTPVNVEMSQISDTAQTLAVVASTVEGTTTATGIGFIQAKETNRIDAIVEELSRLGIQAVADSDGFTVTGGPSSPGLIDPRDDHRMAMSFALLGLVGAGISIDKPSCVNKTFPEFWTMFESMRPSGSPGRPRVVALDGPAGSGKSTVATQLASRLGVEHFDTGAMYRAVAYAALLRGIDIEDSDAVAYVAQTAEISFGDLVVVDGLDATSAIRSAEVTAIVSTTSAIPAVRTELVRLQQEWAAGRHGAVLDGRDIGTVVFPDAPLKVYLTASVEVRARRRFNETEGQTFEEIAADIERRDLADSSRKMSPLRAADDAVIIDTSDRSVDDIVDELVDIARRVWEPLK